MKASARLVAEARPDGVTRLTTLAGQAPLLLRQTFADSPDGDRRAAHVHLVGGAAGPLGGDELHLSLHLGPGAEVRLSSVAASLALPGPHGDESTLDISVRIESGASLTWHPQPLIAARGARHCTAVNIEMAADARLTWHEQTLLGRHGEAPGSAVTRLRVRRADRPLLDHTLAVGPRHRGALGPAVVGTARACAGTLIVDPAWTNIPPADRLTVAARDDADGSIAALLLEAPAVLISALAPDGLALQRLLEPIDPTSGAHPTPGRPGAIRT
jgi:urease accessory protein